MDEKTLLIINNLNITAQNDKPLLSSFNLELKSGDCIGLSAPTGTGKTSLLNYITGIQTLPCTGECQKAPLLKISYAFQEPRLIPSLNVIKNIMLPLQNLMNKDSAQKLAAFWLERLNLKDKEQAMPAILSGGEQQRVGLARAFAYSQAATKHPCILLFDEPFASQDHSNADNIKSLILEQLKEPLRAAFVISHDKAYLESFCRMLFF